MQKRVMFIAILLLAICNKIVAANGIDEISISDFSVSAGASKEVGVMLTNEETYVGFQFDLYLPEGIAVDTFSVNNTRIPGGTTLQMAQQADGAYRFIAFSQDRQPITGNSGAVMTITVKASESVVPNSYSGYLRNVKISTTDGSGVIIAEQPFTVTVKGDEPYAMLTVDSVFSPAGGDVEYSLMLYYDNKRDSRGTTLDIADFSGDWYSIATSVKTVTFDSSFANYYPTSTASWFSGFSNMTTINGLENLRTDNVTNMNMMFMSCTSLESIDVSHFNTEQVADMSSLFAECASLTELDLNSFKTSAVTNMEYMFYMCSSLQKILVSNSWVIGDLTSSQEMFGECSSLVGGMGTAYDANHVDAAYAYIDLANSRPGYFTPKGGYVTKPILNWSGDELSMTSEEGATIMYAVVKSDEASGTGIEYNVYVTPVPVLYDALISVYAAKDDKGQSEIVTFDYPYTAWRELVTAIADAQEVSAQAATSEDVTIGQRSQLDSLITASNAAYSLRTDSLSNIKQRTDELAAMTEAIRQLLNAIDEPYAVLTGDTISGMTLTFYYDKKKEERNGMGVGPFSVGADRAWNESAQNITSVVFDDSFANDTTLTSTAYWFYEFRNLTSIVGITNLKTNNVTSMYAMFSNCRTLPTLDVTGFNTSNVTNMEAMFYRCQSLTSLDLSSFNTSNVTNLAEMFVNCKNLTSLDLSSFRIPNVTRTRQMFTDCYELKTIYVDSEWEIPSYVISHTQGLSMFLNCTNLVGGLGTHYDEEHTDATYAHIDGGASNPGYFTDINAPVKPEGRIPLTADMVFNWNAWGANAEKRSNYPFTDCYYVLSSDTTMVYGDISVIAYADLSSYSRLEVTATNGTPRFLFNRDVTDGQWDADETQSHLIDNTKDGWSNKYFSQEGNMWIVDIKQMVADKGYAHLHAIKGGNWENVNVTKMELVGGNHDAAPEPYAVLSDNGTGSSTLTFYYDTKRGERVGMGVGPYVYSSQVPWFSSRKSITNVVFDDSFADCTSLLGTSNWFFQCDTLSTITGIGNLKTDNVTYMHYMFANCSALNRLDVSGFNTANATNMASMFSGCSGLTSLDVSHFNTEKVAYMDGMFFKCSGLTSLDVSHFNTENVTAMNWMFSNCSSLTTLDVSGFNTANVTNMQGMFSSCSGLMNLDVSGFNTEKVTDMGVLFYQCFNLTSLDVSHFNTSNVTNMNAMFGRCPSLTSLDVSNFNTANVENMSVLFAITGLKSIDISNFNTAKTTNMISMFYGNPDLRTIYVGEGWTTEEVKNSDSMFTGCTKLIGGMGTPYDSTHVDVTYAHIDGGTSNPGYFTRSGDEPWVEPTEQVETPYFSWLNDELSISTKTEGANIYYQLSDTDVNGDEVVNDADYALYSTALTIQRDVIIRVYAEKRGMLTSDTLVLEYPYRAWMDLKDMFNIARSMFSSAENTNKVPEDLLSEMLRQSYIAEDMFKERMAGRGDIEDQASILHHLINEVNSWLQVVASFENGLLTVQKATTLAEALNKCDANKVNESITTIVWASRQKLTDSDMQAISNPNVLIYVTDASMTSVTKNVVVGNDSIGFTAKNIVLTDVTNGNGDFKCTQAFTAERISYTREFKQQTQVDVCRGWETIALPFAVQTVTHERNGVIAPFGNSASGKHFWLRQLTQSGLQPATTIEANMPYLISMPNNTDLYAADFNQGGRVTFTAENTAVPVTTQHVTALADSTILFVPTTMQVGRSSDVWALNVGQVRGANLEGSVFERDFREVRPFETYTVHRSNTPAPRFVPINDINGGNLTGISDASLVNSEKVNNEKWYDMNGRQLQQKPTKGGVYISNGKKVVLR